MGKEGIIRWILSPTNSDFPNQFAQVMAEIRENRQNGLRVFNRQRYDALQESVRIVSQILEDDEDAVIRVFEDEFTGDYGITIESTLILLSARLGEINGLIKVLGNSTNLEIGPLNDDQVCVAFSIPGFWDAVGGGGVCE